MPEEPDMPPASSSPAPDPATKPTPATPPKEEPLGVVGWIVTIIGLPVVIAAFLAWCIGPMYLYQGLVEVSAGRPWLYWAGLPVIALLCLLGWLLYLGSKDKK